MRRWGMLTISGALAAISFYVSRFWGYRLWDRPGLFGLEALPPQGDLVARWLRGTDAAPFELMIWAVGCFLILSAAQSLYDRLTEPGDEEPDDAG